MSFGTFSTSLQGVYSWGVLRTAKFAGMVMDIDRIGAITVDKDNNRANVLAFAQQQGPRQSLNENLVPEQFFNDPNSLQKNVEGVSASKILKLANDQGQRIYQIDQSNVNTILPQLNHESQVITDIRNAVAAGKIVTISQTKISLNGWGGSGYIIADPTNGSGAYMISGGLNGGAIIDSVFSNSFLLGQGIAALIVGVSGLFLASSSLLILSLVLILIAVAIITIVYEIYMLSLIGNIDFECTFRGFLSVGNFAGFATPNAVGAFFGLLSLIVSNTTEYSSRVVNNSCVVGDK